MQIAYKTTPTGSEERTRTFTVYAPKSKVNTSEKMFDDGYAYNVILTVNATNKLGGNAADWNNGGILETTVLNPLALVAEFDLAKVRNTQVLGQGLFFVENHNVKANSEHTGFETNYDNFVAGQDVGLYTWAEAMRLFGYDVDDNTAPQYNPALPRAQRWFEGTAWDTTLKDRVNDKNSDIYQRKYKTIDGQDYYIPNKNEWIAILPYWISSSDSKKLQNVGAKKNLQLIRFTNDWNTVLSDPFVVTIGKEKAGLQEVQIGDEILLPSDYEDQYITKEVGVGSGNYVIYAKRFIGTKYESAWRYEYKAGDASNGGSRMIIKNVMLRENSSESLANDIAKETFFDINSCVERIFPTYGYIELRYNEFDASTNASLSHTSSRRWSSTHGSFRGAFGWDFNSSDALVNGYNCTNGITLRPFKKN